jgi:CheY-like chemotaxis protein
VADLRGIRVLVVEDNEDSRDLLKIMLEYCGAQVTVASGPGEAKARLLELQPDVIVSDVSMPNDGMWLVQEVKRFADERRVGIPVLAVTAGTGSRGHFLQAGFTEFLAKPLNPVALCDTIRRLVQP